MGETADGAALFDRLWQEARVVSDPKGELFSAYGIGRASPLQLFGPKVWFNAAGALLGGSSLNLLPLALIFMAIISIPQFLAASLGSKLARKRAAG